MMTSMIQNYYRLPLTQSSDLTLSGATVQMVIKSTLEEAHWTHNGAKVGTFSGNNDENHCASSPLLCNRIVHKNNDEAFLAFSLQEGEVDCWPLPCPTLSCEYSATLEGDCCPRCVSDPCLADSITYDIRKTCLDSSGVSRLSGSVWTMAGSPCTTCKCKVTGCPGITMPHTIAREHSQAVDSWGFWMHRCQGPWWKQR